MKYLLSLFAGIIAFFGFASTASATAYAIDFTITGGTGAGTASSTSYQGIDQFTEVARSAGDVAFVRRGRASTTNVSVVDFTSDGTPLSPITIEADFDNIWGDFSTSSQTYTVTSGSTTLVASAAITGIVAYDWIYVEGDCKERQPLASLPTTPNGCLFAFPVQNISGNILTLFLPYNGNGAGTGKSLRVMPYAPIWNIPTGTSRWNFDTDNNWFINGIHIQGTDATVSGAVEVDSSVGHIFQNMIFTVGSSNTLYRATDDVYDVQIVQNYSTTSNQSLWVSTSADVYGKVFIKDCYLYSVTSGGTAASHSNVLGYMDATIENGYFAGQSGRYIVTFDSTNDTKGIARLINVQGSSAGTPAMGAIGLPTDNIYAKAFVAYPGGDLTDPGAIYWGEKDSTAPVSQTRALRFFSSTSTANFGSTAIEVHPVATKIGNIWRNALVPLFEYPVYADTTSRTYSVYFRNSTSTAGFATNPTVEELWIECEFWDFPINGTSTRRIKKSTGTIDFVGSNAWQALSVTCQPTHAGMLTLRGYYGKSKETTRANQFLVDNFIEKS